MFVYHRKYSQCQWLITLTEYSSMACAAYPRGFNALARKVKKQCSAIPLIYSIKPTKNYNQFAEIIYIYGIYTHKVRKIQLMIVWASRFVPNIIRFFCC
jgi:hypothetical protein